MPDKNIGLTVDAEIAKLIVAAWLEPLAKLNLPNSIRARAFGGGKPPLFGPFYTTHSQIGRQG